MDTDIWIDKNTQYTLTHTVIWEILTVKDFLYVPKSTKNKHMKYFKTYQILEHESNFCSLKITNYMIEASVPTMIIFLCKIREDVVDLYKWQMFRPSSLHQRQILL